MGFLDETRVHVLGWIGWKVRALLTRIEKSIGADFG